ncbi:hypothetical protein N7491_005854 [Penicillium cf. griseofulvum]|uniref:Uncharacterized protein n=1 Tax=Penicillium cf. griseofulvum TaxID=2972120 RepID=A0A9W9J754_9EURO|nr:hypothetical protein N7472_008539 [Penicillium cf. griseofulvum]KAJ5435259.1 hypothetical protein N7491_005854 [Penicillium cf. griseofulvum]KAJ5453093.1 hypothetical protein N7445_001276 [Penicillium cf. griseofulvum]
MPPVYHGQWSYNIDTLYVTSSCGHVHPRASYAELDDIFSTPLGARRTRPDNPSHWYEAQLLHFGLPRTKYKATAKMRLMDAFQDGTLNVPDEILQIEDTLSRNWMKQDLEDRILGPSMRLSLDTGIVKAPATGMTEFGATQRPSSGEQGNIFGAGSIGGAGMQGNMRYQRNKMQTTHPRTNKRKGTNGEPCTRPMKTARCRGKTGASDLQVQIDINSNGNTFHQKSAVTPLSVGNGRGRLALDRELQKVGYQTMPLLQHGTSEPVSMSFCVQQTP